MSQTLLEIGGRSSNLAKLDACNHWRDSGLAGEQPEVQRGNRIHPWIPKFVFDQPLGSWKLEEAPEVAAAEWVATEAKKVLTRLECEKKMQLMDLFVSPPEVILEGSADIVGWNKKEEIWEVWDAKSGRERDYSLQLMSYALMLMDQTGEVEVRIRVAYCDLKLFQEAIVSRGDCEERIFGLVERIRIGAEPPVENEYCSQCARQSICPVWVVPAEEALLIMNPDMTPLLDPSLTPASRLELIKKEPAMLGKFIDAWRKAQTLVEKSGIEDHAKELLIAGKEVPGWKAVEYQGRAFYNKEQIEKILAEWGESASDFLAVNRERYEGACNNSDNEIIQPEGRSKSFYKLLRKK
jgi:PD-(D/E)XK nuclease superfamily